MSRTHLISLTLTALALAAAPGCVRRTMTINTDPQGALIALNDREVGRTPVTVDFTWYGDYDVIARLDGYQTLKTHYRANPPWYEIWPLDFVSEVLVPVELHDSHEMPPLYLEPEPEPDAEALVQRAEEMRDRTIYEK
jgi:hypothetical protein